MKKYRPFHLVILRPWPIIISFIVITFFMGIIIIIKFSRKVIIINIILLIFTIFIWGKEVHRESYYIGEHNKQVVLNIKLGIIIFIISECFFFLRIFWTFINSIQRFFSLRSINYSLSLIISEPWELPLLNTLILISSGFAATISIIYKIQTNLKESLNWITIRILIGVIFSIIQIIEYYECESDFSYSSYSSIYFIGTRFHGLHVIIGLILLIICLKRIKNIFIRRKHITLIICRIWYWHFVDVVWIILYVIFYWWIY